MRAFVGILSLVFVSFSTLSCAERQNSLSALESHNHAGGLHGGTLRLLSEGTLTVVDRDGQPVPDALIMIGYEPGNPFAGNVFNSDEAGQAGIPADWKAALPLTVQAAGYIAVTIPVAVPGDYTITLNPQDSMAEYEIKGTTKDFGNLTDNDDRLDFGLIIPAMTRAQLFNFDVASIISPHSDTIEIIGNEVKIPSNLALPPQRESYFFPIDFNKPDYRVYVRDMGPTQVSVTHGYFPFTRVIKDIRKGKSIFEVINHFTFMEGSVQTVEVDGNKSGVDLSVNQIRFDSAVAVTAPRLNDGQIMVSIATIEQNGQMVPTDLKRIESAQSMNLKSNAGYAPSVVSIMLQEIRQVIAPMAKWFGPLMTIEGKMPAVAEAKTDYNQISVAMNSAEGGAMPTFMPLVAKPMLEGNVLKLNMPTLPDGLTAVASYMVFSEVERVGDGDLKSERRTRLWELWSSAWLDQVELPKVDFERKDGRIYRWEVMFMARPTAIVGDLRPMQMIDLNSITHVTRNALDL